MKDSVRVVLVVPNARSRQDLQRQLEAISEVDLLEVCHAYQTGIKRIAALVPDLAIIVLDSEYELATELIETITRSHPEVAVIPAGSDRDPGVILHAIRAGAREFLPIPTTEVEILELIQRACPSHEPSHGKGPRGPQVIAVAGAGGGVGCTTIAVNLATTLAKLSRRDTVLADFDMLLGSLEESLAVIPDNSLEVVVRNLDEIDSALLKRWLPRHTCGLYMLPHPVSMEDAARIEYGDLHRVLNLLRESFTTIVIDTSKGLQVTDFLAFEMADVILLTLQLNLNCTRNAVRLLQYFGQFEGLREKVRLVVNRVNSPLSEISLRKAEELLKTEITWQVPNATKLFRPARTQGVPIDEVDGGAASKAYQAILEIAKSLHPYPGEPQKTRKRMFSAFR
jgi:pilus assembly protein CpaE